MSGTSEVAPDTLTVDLQEGGVEVEYTDGRTVFYHGVPTPVETATTAPGKETHVLVTNEAGTHGVLTYVNERTTEDEILEDSGVGRILLDRGEETAIFPGVTVQESELRVTVRAELETVAGRVFVFEEDAMGEQSYELVDEPPPAGDGPDADPAGDEGSDGTA